MADTVQYCTICRKPFTQEPSLRRHIAYCRRTQNKPRKRQSSCRSCNHAKVKCNFQTPCSRCTTRGIECIYASPRRASTVQAAPQSTGQPAPVPEQLDISTLDDALDFQLISDEVWLDELSFADLNTTPQSQASQHVDVQTLAPDMDIPKSQVSYENSIGNPTNEMLLGSYKDVGTLDALRSRDPFMRRTANFLLHSLRTFPEKMLNNDDLPYFIHPSSKDQPLLEPLVACQRICQMFATRTPEALPFIWRCIRMEELRFRDDDMTTEELIAGAQAQVVYIMMMVMESGLRRLEWAQEMLMMCGAVCVRLNTSCTRYFDDVSQLDDGNSWKTWIVAESLRRKQLVWIIMGLVFNLQNGLRCYDLDNIRSLFLPSSKLQWEASDSATWEQRLEFGSGKEMQTVGDLIDIFNKSEDPSCTRQLDTWNAKTDQLGSMLNLAVGML